MNARVSALIAVAAGGALVVLGIQLLPARDAITAAPVLFAFLLAVTLTLQAVSVPVPARGSISVASLGILAAAFLLGPGAAMLIGICAAAAQWARSRGRLHRAVFDAANFALAAAAAAGVFDLLASGPPTSRHVVAGALAGAMYCLVNTGLLCIAMGLSEGAAPVAVWRERFRWATPHYLTAGPLALLAVVVYGSLGLAAFGLFATPYAIALAAHRRLVEAT